MDHGEQKPQEEFTPEQSATAGAGEATEEQVEATAAASDEAVEKSEPQGRADETSALTELNGKYLRLHAEFENFRRRTARESLEQGERAEWKVLEKLLTVVDNFDRAIDNGPGEEAEKLFKGMQLIHTQFREFLKGLGLESIGQVGDTFDPYLHDALMKQPSAEIPEGKIAAIFEKGYSAKGHVLRHAKVVVSAGTEN